MTLEELLKEKEADRTIEVVVFGAFNGRRKTIAKGLKLDEKFIKDTSIYLHRIVAGAKTEGGENGEEVVYRILIYPFN